MDYYNGLQVIQLDRDEYIYREYRNVDNQLVNPTSPVVRIYDPSGTRVASAAPTQESTGVYYYQVSLDSSNPEGQYQAYWEGTITGQLVTMDLPQYLWIQKVPWQMGAADELVQAVRRMIGDTNPNDYRIATQDMYYYLSDAVSEVQMEYPMGYTAVVAPLSLSITKSDGSTPTSLANSLFKIKCAEIVLTGVLFDVLFDGANINTGDIKINMKDTIAGRRALRNDLQTEFSGLIRKIKMTMTGIGSIVDNYMYNKYGDTTAQSGNTP